MTCVSVMAELTALDLEAVHVGNRIGFWGFLGFCVDESGAERDSGEAGIDRSCEIGCACDLWMMHGALCAVV